ncbi:MAG: DUF4838 domain-containing protein [Lentisphaeria bacterium]|nr:DUF4838 domain-containing protein [Lentisphaeria bacterium]
MKILWTLLLCIALGSFSLEGASSLKRSIVISNRIALTLTAESCRIVIPSRPNPTVKFAAAELQQLLSAILGKKIPVAATPGRENNIFVGVCPASEKQKLDVSKLARDGFFIKTVGKNIYILGKDDPKERTDVVAGSGGYWSFDYERATLFGVYDFLERFCGVRFYFPGELGTILPKKNAIPIPEISIVEKPDMRRRFYYGWADGPFIDGATLPPNKRHPLKCLNMMRVRFGTENMNCCHGINGFSLPARFGKTNPEYFRMSEHGIRQTGTSGKFAGQLCWTSPVKEVIYQDLRAYFKGEHPSKRNMSYNGKVRWWFPTFRNYFVDVMPQDSFAKCYCKNCMAAFRNHEDYASEMIWNNVIDWGNRLKKENIKGILSMAAYYPYRAIPKRAIPDNIEVQVCVTGPWVTDPARWNGQKQLIADWNKKLGRPVHLWTYVNKHGTTLLPGIPSCTPRAVGRFYKEVAPYIYGTFMESECDKFIYFAMNYYVLGKVLWNTDTDVDALMEEYYSLMFGKAAPVMKKVMDDFENIWIKQIAGRTVDTPLGPVASVPSNQMIWNHIYSPGKLKELSAAFDKAARSVPAGSLESKRIAMFKKEFLAPLYEASAAYLKKTGAVQGLKFRIPSAAIRLIPFLGRNPQPAKGKTVATKVNAKLTADALIFKFECEEPAMADIIANDRKHDDPKMWEDNSIELFLAPGGRSKKYYQLIINSQGNVFDASYTVLGKNAIQDLKWNSDAKTVVTKKTKVFVIEVTIPRKSLGKLPETGFPVNFCRNRIIKNSEDHTLYTWSPYITGFHDIENFGLLVSDKGEMVAEGNFDDIRKMSRKNWGYYKNKIYYGWIGNSLLAGKSGCELDTKTFFSAPQSMKIVSTDAKGNALTQYFYGKKFKPDTTYKISCVLKFKDVVPTKARGGLLINLWDDANRWFPKNPLTGTADWTYLSFTHKTSANVHKSPKSYLNIWLHNATGTVWVDDVSVEEVTEK